MKVLSIRRITQDRRHNAFTGACWFKGNLYVGYRQGDDHVCPQGRIVVLRSRDDGVTWDTVAVLRGDADTRDAALHTDGNRLYAVAYIERGKGRGVSGCAVTEDGDRWTPFRPFEGADGFVLWRPVWYDGTHYCAGYLHNREKGYGVHWFESDDVHQWKQVRPVYESADEMPNECYLEVLPDGTATMLMRCEGSPKHPTLCRSQFPFTSWDMQRLDDIKLTGPALWTVDGRVYISGRWHPLDAQVAEEEDYFAHTAVFRVRDGKTYLICVLPSGPKPDHSYMGVARWPTNRHRFALSFYANAVANEDPAIPQWNHPDIYVADVLFGAEPIPEMLVSDLVETAAGLDDATVPDPASGALTFRPVQTARGSNLIDVREIIRGRKGLVYFVRDIEVGPWDLVDVHLGYDGPVKVWWNGREVFQGRATGPAAEDQTSLRLESRHGTNRLAVAIDTRGGEAQGIFARWERAWPDAVATT